MTARPRRSALPDLPKDTHDDEETLADLADLPGGSVRGRPRRCPGVWPAWGAAPRGERDERQSHYRGSRLPDDRQTVRGRDHVLRAAAGALRAGRVPGALS